MKLTQEERMVLRKIQSKGGQNSLGRDRKRASEMGKKGAITRWGKLKVNQKSSEKKV